jgi:formylmethanofuran dehydrogenase subunit B
MTPSRAVEHVTCLGCGCACDDIAVVVEKGRIAALENACPLGQAWFGDGTVPEETLVKGRTTSLARALSEATKILTGAGRPLVYLAADLSCEAQREAVAIADRLRAVLDSLGGEGSPAVLAAQRRGRAGATLGEIRQRADVVVFWAVDPADRYPRYASRYAVAPRGLEAPEGRNSRTVIAVDVGPFRGPSDADVRVAIAGEDEVDGLGVMRATVQNRLAGGGGNGADGRFRPAAELARRLMQARYVALVADGEGSGPAPADPDRAEALVALAQALNGPARCALSTLRGGGNRAGADQVLTWQTGFPCAADFARGYPEYRPHAGAGTLLAAGEIDAALVVGAGASLPASVSSGLSRVPTVVIGPRASAAPFPAAVAIDTGIAGIHEAGMAFRMDDVPLPLRPALAGPRAAAATLQALREALEP